MVIWSCKGRIYIYLIDYFKENVKIWVRDGFIYKDKFDVIKHMIYDVEWNEINNTLQYDVVIFLIFNITQEFCIQDCNGFAQNIN